MKNILTTILATATLSAVSFAADFAEQDKQKQIATNRLDNARAVLTNIDNPNAVGVDIYVDNNFGDTSGSALFVYKGTMHENGLHVYKHRYWSLSPIDRVDGPSKNSTLLCYRAFILTPTQNNAINAARKADEAAGGNEKWCAFLQRFKAEKEPALLEEVTTLESELSALTVAQQTT